MTPSVCSTGGQNYRRTIEGYHELGLVRGRSSLRRMVKFRVTYSCANIPLHLRHYLVRLREIHVRIHTCSYVPDEHRVSAHMIGHTCFCFHKDICSKNALI